MEINDAHIREAETFLIGGNRFDEDERVPFIKNLETCDLLAVPGSGKTTALQAKLYCLAKQMPFADGSGVLVLSHTNKAVEEIEKRLKDHCPQLFQYPNFVGTVQSFVNGFLANLWCIKQYGSYIHINDDEAYKRAMKSFYYSLPWKPRDSDAKFLKNDLYRRANYNRRDISTAEKESNTITYLCNLKLDTTNNKICSGSKDTTVYKLNGNTNDFFIAIRDRKIQLLSQGLINYRDSYCLADEYIKTCMVRPILRKRFKYIFVDEAQDLEKYQLDIIEAVFNSRGSDCVIQRIGDTNQSIYNNGKKVKEECSWKPREKKLYLKKSHRLTSEIAQVVDNFTLNKGALDESGKYQFVVEGLRTLDVQIKPHLIIFDKDCTDKLIPKFRELINQYNLYDGIDGSNTRQGFRIIGWNGTWNGGDNNGKLRLENIFPNEYSLTQINRTKKKCLCDYLDQIPNERTLNRYQENIWDTFCAILTLVDCKYSQKINGRIIERHYTTSLLWKKLLKESYLINGILSEQELLEFKSELYKWSFSIATHNKTSDTYTGIKTFVINQLSKWFDFNIEDSVNDFLGDHYEPRIDEHVANPQADINTPPIEVCSVHSVKGQTHCATMYVETSYNDYETKKKQIISMLQKQTHTLLPKRSIEATKMIYVGFSRPTHLLCFAVLKENLTEEQIAYFQVHDNGWECVDLTLP